MVYVAIGVNRFGTVNKTTGKTALRALERYVEHIGNDPLYILTTSEINASKVRLKKSKHLYAKQV